MAGHLNCFHTGATLMMFAASSQVVSAQHAQNNHKGYSVYKRQTVFLGMLGMGGTVVFLILLILIWKFIKRCREENELMNSPATHSKRHRLSSPEAKDILIEKYNDIHLQQRNASYVNMTAISAKSFEDEVFFTPMTSVPPWESPRSYRITSV